MSYGLCIYCDMERETIVYYYPIWQIQHEPAAGGRHGFAAKRRWFQEAALQTRPVTAEEEFCVLGCGIPPFYYRKKPWKAQVLSETMETALGGVAGMADTYVHPEIGLLLQERTARWMPRESTIRLLVKCLLKRYGKETLERSGTVTVLLGKAEAADRQMETTWELLQPYLPRINRMLIYYEKPETLTDDSSEEIGQAADSRWDPQEWLGEYLEAYSYEYGLVPWLEPYREEGTGGVSSLRCGREKCGGVILDYGAQPRYPKISSPDCICIDVMSNDEKERIFRRKSLSIPYISPLKYLDTVTKNSYDG